MARLMLVLLVVAPIILLAHAGSKSYTLKVSKDGKDYNERITVDTRKKTETSQMRVASSGKDAGDTIYDFKRGMTMTRLPEAKACFLSNSIGNVLRPADLLKLLKLLSSASVKVTPQREERYKVVGKLNDRSSLSTEMADLCANLPIYRVVKGDVNQNDMGEKTRDAEDADDADVAEMPEQGSKQRRGFCHWVCSPVCWYRCRFYVCWKICRYFCRRVCG